MDDDREGIADASEGYRDLGRMEEAGRILAMDPDIVMTSGTVQDFLHDPRWRGLQASLTHRVYVGPGDFRKATPMVGLTYNPMWARWTAEIAHPERFHTDLRAKLRERVARFYGYPLSESDLDELLRLTENSGAAGYSRFQ